MKKPLKMSETLKLSPAQWKVALKQAVYGLRVALPGIVKSFDAAKQTVEVQLAIRENMRVSPKPIELPLLRDVPIIIPRAGGFALTLPVQVGDECLVIFADMCIDAWWQNGGVQNQVDKRRHDLSDGFAILGCWSQPNVLPSYSTNSAVLRSEDGSVEIEVINGQVNIKAPTVNINAGGASTVNINGRNFLNHSHSGVQTGGGATGGVI